MAKRGRSSRGIGYKKPPRHAQFSPGQSGNPRGRPKGSKRLTKVARKEAARPIAYLEDGVRKKIRTDHAIVRQALIKAATGDFRAIPIALKLLDREETAPDAPGSREELDRPEDKLVIASIIRRIRSMDEPPAEETAGAPEAPKPPQTPSTEN